MGIADAMAMAMAQQDGPGVTLGCIQHQGASQRHNHVCHFCFLLGGRRKNNPLLEVSLAARQVHRGPSSGPFRDLFTMPCRTCARSVTLQEGCWCQQSWTTWSFGMLWRMSSCLRTSQTNIYGRQRVRALTPHVQPTPGSLWAHLALSHTSAYGSLGRSFGVRCSSS